jgi:hypothetical protein
MTGALHAACIQNDPLSLAGALAGLQGGTLSATQLVEDCLARIAARNDALHAFLHLDAEGARGVAATPAAGPLSGIPWAIKDTFDVAGLPATANSRFRAGRVATRDAALVQVLRGTGAVHRAAGVREARLPQQLHTPAEEPRIDEQEAHVHAQAHPCRLGHAGDAPAVEDIAGPCAGKGEFVRHDAPRRNRRERGVDSPQLQQENQ